MQSTTSECVGGLGRIYSSILTPLDVSPKRLVNTLRMCKDLNFCSPLPARSAAPFCMGTAWSPIQAFSYCRPPVHRFKRSCSGYPTGTRDTSVPAASWKGAACSAPAPTRRSLRPSICLTGCAARIAAQYWPVFAGGGWTIHSALGDLYSAARVGVLGRALVAWYGLRSGAATLAEMGRWFSVAGATLGQAIRQHRSVTPDLFNRAILPGLEISTDR